MARRIRAGDEAALEEICRINLRFVLKLALRYRWRGGGVEDFLGAGWLALRRAALGYDPDRPEEFITYAGVILQREFLDVRHAELDMIRLPRALSAELAGGSGTAYAGREHLIELGRCSQQRAEEQTEAVRKRARLAPDWWHPPTESAQIEIIDRETEAWRAERYRQALQLIDVMPPRMRQAMRLYFGIGSGLHTLQEVRIEMGTSYGTVRGLVQRGLIQIRRAFGL